jgi:CDP-2,3-bis-(O-geranylgeranyl)-sn-glycerol synthase
MSLQWSSLLSLLGLILLANGLPALLGLLMGAAKALDAGRTLADGRPLLGPSKTWRGLVAALVGTTLGGLALGLHWTLGLGVAVGAMVGDLVASFIKRRLGYPASASVPLLDQIPEALLPALLVKAELALAWSEVALVTLAFVVADLGLTPLGRRLFRGRSGRGRV